MSVSVPIDPQDPNHAPVVGEPGFEIDSMSTRTGVVEGHVNVTDEDQQGLHYGLDGDVDPQIGSVYVDPYDGTWTFTPNPEARLAAFRTPADPVALPSSPPTGRRTCGWMSR